MGCGVLWNQINEIDRALRVLKPHLQLPGMFDAYNLLNAQRGKLLAQVGLKFPRTILQLLRLTGLSPWSIAVFHDLEAGWLVEARVKPGTPPVYHYVSDAVATQILGGGLTHELEAQLMTPDEYLGE